MYSSYGVLPFFWTCLNCVCNVHDFIASFLVNDGFNDMPSILPNDGGLHDVKDAMLTTQHDILHDGTLNDANPIYVGCGIEHGTVDEQGDK